MQKVYIYFEYEINNVKYAFKCEPNSPIADAKEAAFLFLKEIGQIEDANKANQQAQENKEESLNVTEEAK